MDPYSLDNNFKNITEDFDEYILDNSDRHFIWANITKW